VLSACDGRLSECDDAPAWDSSLGEVGTITEGPELATLIINSPRPLSHAARTLSERYGFLVSYEDPRYTPACDLEDGVRRGGQFRVEFPKSAGPAVIVEKVVRTADSALPGSRFRVMHTGNRVHIIPLELPAPLDSRISLSAEPRTDWELIKAICDAVSEAAKVKVIENSSMQGGIVEELRDPSQPGGFADTRPRYLVSAKDEVARDVLHRALDEIFRDRDGQVTWQMLYGNSATEDEYVLNVMAVPK
jgi:hypothetical protein